jgi:hypothetical protein
MFNETPGPMALHHGLPQGGPRRRYELRAELVKVIGVKLSEGQDEGLALYRGHTLFQHGISFHLFVFCVVAYFVAWPVTASIISARQDPILADDIKSPRTLPSVIQSCPQVGTKGVF